MGSKSPYPPPVDKMIEHHWAVFCKRCMWPYFGRGSRAKAISCWLKGVPKPRYKEGQTVYFRGKDHPWIIQAHRVVNNKQVSSNPKQAKSYHIVAYSVQSEIHPSLWRNYVPERRLTTMPQY